MDDRDLTRGDPLGGPAPTDPFGSTGDPFGQAPERAVAAPYGGGPAPPGAFAVRDRGPVGAWPPPEHAYAEWWRRVLATVLDSLIVGGVTLGILAALGLGVFGDGDGGTVELVVAGIVGVVLFAGIALFYAPVLMAKTNGQTLGKMATGCRVVRPPGKRVDFVWSAYREVLIKGLVVGIASAITGGIAYLVDVLWPLWDGQKRALHDLVVDSRVVKT
jgi:uncharacterized RDD family membrane protein YckC